MQHTNSHTHTISSHNYLYEIHAMRRRQNKIHERSQTNEANNSDGTKIGCRFGCEIKSLRKKEINQLWYIQRRRRRRPFISSTCYSTRINNGWWWRNQSFFFHYLLLLFWVFWHRSRGEHVLTSTLRSTFLFNTQSKLPMFCILPSTVILISKKESYEWRWRRYKFIHPLTHTKSKPIRHIFSV